MVEEGVSVADLWERVFQGRIIPSLTHTEKLANYAPRSQVPEEVTDLLIATVLMVHDYVLS
jgi:hypothetical protein